MTSFAAQDGYSVPTDAILANTRALVRAVERRDQGRTDLSGSHVARARYYGEWDRRGWWSGNIGSKVRVIAAADGTIRSFRVSTTPEDELARIENTVGEGISRDEALAASREYLEVLHPGISWEPFVVELRGKSGVGGSNFPTNAHWEVQALPKIGNRRLLYTSSVLLNIDCDRGQLINYSGGAMPKLDLAEAPVVPQEQAERANLDAYARHKPFAHGRIRMTWLAVGAANFAGPNEMTAEQKRLAEEDFAIPLYVTHIDDVDGLNPDTGAPTVWQMVFADARSGRTMGIVDQWLYGEPAAPSGRGPRWKLGQPAALSGTDATAPLVLGSLRTGGWQGTGVPAVLRQGPELWHVLVSPDGRRLRFPGDSSEWRPGAGLARIIADRPSRPAFGSR
ncbi:MAG: hypothetical protein AB7F50_12195 [Fimbriimonadaceae bacterium]